MTEPYRVRQLTYRSFLPETQISMDSLSSNETICVASLPYLLMV